MAKSNPAALVESFKRLAELAFRVTTTQLVHPARFKMNVPEGYTYENFNAVGHPTVWSTIRHFEIARLLGFWADTGDNFLDMRKIDKMIFIASLKLSCDPGLYNPDMKKQPVETDNELVYVGKTSFKIRSNLFLSQAKGAMVQQDISFVMVDTETRRPTVPPAWWVDKFAPYSLPNEGPIKANHLNFSNWTGKVYDEEYVVRSMDLDAYFHLNNICFIRICYEAYVSSFVRQFGHANEADAFRNVKDLSCIFRGEARLGDLLKISFAVDPNDEDTCHFLIMNGSRLIFQCLIKFFRDSFLFYSFGQK
ncbi:hypothetical protein EGW08_023071 [Elysia chlorotica]|uniref:Acyl-ACP thioesterase n=1 Tax=Elysia chlorotica TaxID=188477 RepID=A0A3S1AWK5_ELYCH|nr:hypothetical protein EGW08_023071 [Elysia chlorotica]